MLTVVLQQAVAQAAERSPQWLDHASELLRMIFALGFVCVLAWLVLRFAASRGIGVGKASKGTKLEVIERLALDSQRGLVIVRVEQRKLLIGVGSGAAPQLITELDGNAASFAASLDASDALEQIHDAIRRDATH